MRRSIALLAVAATVLFTFARSAPAQEGTSAGALIIPNSSVERQNDISVRAHSNARLLFADGAVKPANSPGPTSETPASLACVYDLVKPVAGCPISGTTTNPSGGSDA